MALESGDLTQLEKMKGNLSPAEFSKFQQTQGIKGMGDALPTQSSALLGNPAMNDKIHNAIGAVSHEGQPLVATPQNQSAVSAAAKPYVPGQIAGNPLPTPSGAPGSQSVGGFLGGLKNAAMDVVHNPMGAVKAGLGYVAEHPGAAAMGAARGLGGAAIEAVNSFAPRFSNDTYLGQAGNNLRDTAAHIGAGLTAGGVLGGIGGGLYDIGKKVYDNAGTLAQLPGAIMGRDQSAASLQKTTQGLKDAMQRHPENVNQGTYDQLATAQRQNARNFTAPMPAGVPEQGVINNAPVPQGMPAPVPMSQMPGAKAAAAAAPKPQGFQGPTDEEMAAFRKQTGTAFNAKSVNDKLSLERMRNGEETFDSKQANAYRAAHPGYRPGMYTQG